MGAESTHKPGKASGTAQASTTANATVGKSTLSSPAPTSGFDGASWETIDRSEVAGYGRGDVALRSAKPSNAKPGGHRSGGTDAIVQELIAVLDHRNGVSTSDADVSTLLTSHRAEIEQLHQFQAIYADDGAQQRERQAFDNVFYDYNKMLQRQVVESGGTFADAYNTMLRNIAAAGSLITNADAALLHSFATHVKARHDDRIAKARPSTVGETGDKPERTAPKTEDDRLELWKEELDRVGKLAKYVGVPELEKLCDAIVDSLDALKTGDKSKGRTAFEVVRALASTMNATMALTNASAKILDGIASFYGSPGDPGLLEQFGHVAETMDKIYTVAKLPTNAMKLYRSTKLALDSNAPVGQRIGAAKDILLSVKGLATGTVTLFEGISKLAPSTAAEAGGGAARLLAKLTKPLAAKVEELLAKVPASSRAQAVEQLEKIFAKVGVSGFGEALAKIATGANIALMIFEYYKLMYTTAEAVSEAEGAMIQVGWEQNFGERHETTVARAAALKPVNTSDGEASRTLVMAVWAFFKGEAETHFWMEWNQGANGEALRMIRDYKRKYGRDPEASWMGWRQLARNLPARVHDFIDAHWKKAMTGSFSWRTTSPLGNGDAVRQW